MSPVHLVRSPLGNIVIVQSLFNCFTDVSIEYFLNTPLLLIWLTSFEKTSLLLANMLSVFSNDHIAVSDLAENRLLFIFAFQEIILP